MNKMKLVWIFVDGVGYGSDDPSVNPWASVRNGSIIATKGNHPTREGAHLKLLDACLGVPGLPQSATGTTAMLTGVNAPKAVGKHLSGFPNQALRDIISEYSVHKQMLVNGFNPTFANAYNDVYFRRPESRQSVTTHAVRAAGLPFRMMDAYRNGEAVFHDLTGDLIRSQGNDDKLAPPVQRLQRFRDRLLKEHKDFIAELEQEELPLITPEEAARRIVHISNTYDLTLFEYVKTDLAGHSGDMQWALTVVDEVMRFLDVILNTIDLSETTLLITSDHGNSEDLSVKTHTRSPVPAVAFGPHGKKILSQCDSIADIVGAVQKVFKM